MCSLWQFKMQIQIPKGIITKNGLVSYISASWKHCNANFKDDMYKKWASFACWKVDHGGSSGGRKEWRENDISKTAREKKVIFWLWFFACSYVRILIDLMPLCTTFLLLRPGMYLNVLEVWFVCANWTTIATSN